MIKVKNGDIFTIPKRKLKIKQNHSKIVNYFNLTDDTEITLEGITDAYKKFREFFRSERYVPKNFYSSEKIKINSFTLKRFSSLEEFYSKGRYENGWYYKYTFNMSRAECEKLLPYIETLEIDNLKLDYEAFYKKDFWDSRLDNVDLSKYPKEIIDMGDNEFQKYISLESEEEKQEMIQAIRERLKKEKEELEKIYMEDKDYTEDK